jgi:DHA1 family bicyclomycin/chloramphenicol resistance-like MFS transporter
VALAVLGLALTLMAILLLPETLPHDRRRPAGLRQTTQTFGSLLRERRFVGFVLVCGLGAGAMLAYIAGSPFVLQNVYGASPQVYGLLFATNAVALVVGAQINAHLVMGRDPQRLLGFGLAAMVAAGAVLVTVVTVLHDAGMPSVMPALTLLLFSWSFIQANAVAAALTDHPQVAGTAAALLGLSQFALGAPLVPLVGVRGDDTALPMAIVILACGIGATVAFRALVIGTPRARIATAPQTSDA